MGNVVLFLQQKKIIFRKVEFTMDLDSLTSALTRQVLFLLKTIQQCYRSRSG